MKQQIATMLGFKGFATAAITIAGIELMHRIRKGTIRTGTSGCPRSTCACSVECRAPSLKSRQHNTGRFPAPAICTRAEAEAGRGVVGVRSARPRRFERTHRR